MIEKKQRQKPIKTQDEYVRELLYVDLRQLKEKKHKKVVYVLYTSYGIVPYILQFLWSYSQY